MNPTAISGIALARTMVGTLAGRDNITDRRAGIQTMAAFAVDDGRPGAQRA